MKSYNARSTPSSDPRFDRFPITLKTGAPVHKSTKLSWIEELDEDADKFERDWYEQVVRVNVRNEDG